MAEREEVDADAKWDEDVAAAEALRADLMARKAGDYKPKVLESLAKSATDLQASGRLCHAAEGGGGEAARARAAAQRAGAPAAEPDEDFDPSL